MQEKDLFKSLVNHKISTTEVNNLCNNICQKMTSKCKLNSLNNIVMQWKYADVKREKITVDSLEAFSICII